MNTNKMPSATTAQSQSLRTNGSPYSGQPRLKSVTTIETEEAKITIYVPLRKKEDGTLVAFEDLSHLVASLKVGSIVKVQWVKGEDLKNLWIRKVEKARQIKEVSNGVF